MGKVAQRMQYFGQVQGVGFRRRAELAARDLPVGGFVRNLPDGSVELVAEGEEADVQELLRRVSSRMADEIEAVQATTVPPAGLAAFSIRR